jgi:hypothetical protein
MPAPTDGHGVPPPPSACTVGKCMGQGFDGFDHALILLRSSCLELHFARVFRGIQEWTRRDRTVLVSLDS